MTWHVKARGAYPKETQEAIDNATEIYNVLGGQGWTVNAVAGLLGNMDVESGYNPWRYQNDDVQTQASVAAGWELGYGLVQFSPAKKYIGSSYTTGLQGYDPNFLDKSGGQYDGVAQCLAINGALPGQYIPTSTYPLSYDEYKASTEDAGTLAMAFLLNYERPGDPSATENRRREAAAYWYDVLQGHTPEPPGPTPVYGDTFPRGMGWRRLRFGRRRIES